MSVVTLELLELIKYRFQLNLHGTHGIVHWGHVYENGMELSNQEGVKRPIVELFSVFHDSKRQSDHQDNLHGLRGAELAYELREYVPLNDDDFELLSRSCRLHTHSKTDIDITVQVCFDSDRLDLGRVGNKPIAELLCSPMAKEMETIEWAYRKSLYRTLPDNAFGLSLEDDHPIFK